MVNDLFKNNNNGYLNKFNVDINIYKLNTFFINIINKKNWFFFEKNFNSNSEFFSESYDINIKKIKFKPGYSIVWRESRLVLKKILNLNFIYQKKLTNYILRYKKFIQFNSFFFDNFKLINVIIFSKIITDYNILLNLIKNGFIYINGCLTINPFFYLFKNDFIQLIISKKYYIFYKFFLNLLYLKKIRLKSKNQKKLNNIYLETAKQKNNSFSWWILDNKNIFLDVSKFIEIDYFTLSIFFLNDKSFFNNLNWDNFLQNKNSILNMYNWKYIN